MECLAEAALIWTNKKKEKGEKRKKRKQNIYVNNVSFKGFLHRQNNSVAWNYK